jgi:O-acetyl-ADP-ribose deacetylase (regulator of RNase III)
VKLSVVKADITTLIVDAIVNAANTELLPGGGVCGRIYQAAGPELAEACALVGPCDTGRCKITPGYRLPAKHVIHAVGPVYRAGDSFRMTTLLAGAYASALHLADQMGLRSIAFPCISTGIYGYPADEARRVAVGTVKFFNAHHLTDCTFCVFSDADLNRYTAALEHA